jgi:hypothetical protein
MVEFGAGGTVQAPTETTTTAPAGTDGGADAAAGEGGAAGGAAGGGGGITVGPTPITPTNRRRKKAKGWFCPVCRQPYTSLLRITTTPPPPVDEATMALAMKEAGVGAGAGGEEVGSPTVESAVQSPTTPVAPTAAAGAGAGTIGTVAASNANANVASGTNGETATTTERQGGVARLFSLRRPGFLSRNSSTGSGSAARARDVEAQA